MAGYLFNRPGTNTAPWAWQPSNVPPDDEVAPTRPAKMAISQPFPTPLRAAAVAYVVLLSPAIPDEVQVFGRDVQPTSAPGPQRAANSAYWIATKAPVADVLADPPIRPAITDFAKRPFKVLTWRGHLPHDEEKFEEYPRRRIIPDRAPGPKRAANSAYWRNNQFMIDDFIPETNPPIVPVITERAPAPQRAANSAYWWHNVQPPPDELISQGRESIPDRAPAPQRAAQTAYDISVMPQRSGVPVAPTISERADGPRRASGSAYWIAESFQIEDSDVPPPALLPDRAPVQRAANTAYWFDNNKLVVPDVVQEEPPIQTNLPDQAPGARRAAASEYWWHNEAQIPDKEEPPEDLRVQMPDRRLLPQAARRAANTEYWITRPPVKPDLFSVPRKLRVRVIPPGRAPNTAYWFQNGVPVEDEVPEHEITRTMFPQIVRRHKVFRWHITLPPDGIIPMSRGTMPNQAPGPQRAAIYWIQGLDAAQLEPKPDFDDELQQQVFPDRAEGPRRAANVAYWMTRNLGVLSVPPPEEKIDDPVCPAKPDESCAPPRIPDESCDTQRSRPEETTTARQRPGS